jgi:hypothetical protein
MNDKGYVFIPELKIPPVELEIKGIKKNGRRHKKNWFTRLFEVRMSKKAYNPDPTLDSILTVVTVIGFAILFLLAWIASS